MVSMESLFTALKTKVVGRTHEAPEFVYKSYNSVSEIPKNLLKGAVSCAQDAFGHSMGEAEVVEHLDGDILLIVERGHVVGFATTRNASPAAMFPKEFVGSESGLYLAGAVVRKEYQGRGLYKELNRIRIGQAMTSGTELIFTRTQNPRVETGMRSVLEEYEEQGYIKGFFLERKKQPGAYGRMLTEQKPVVPEGSPYEDLNYEQGDAFIITIRLRY